jgi:transcriptional regulator with XRE-family HTH domain
VSDVNPAQKANARASCRRPIEEWEVPHLERLGVAVRTARLAAGLTRLELAIRAGVSDVTVYRIEAAVRRTRASTLRRIADALCDAAPTLGDPARVAADLSTVGGLGLAPESEYHERIERRRARRKRRSEAMAENFRKICEKEGRFS